MVNGNEVSLWVAGAKRNKSVAEIVAYAAMMADVDTEGRAFWLAVKAVAGKSR